MSFKIKYKETAFPFVHPFTISKGTKSFQPALQVELEFMRIRGYGEAPAISYYHIPVTQMIDDLEAKRGFIEKFSFNEPDRFWHFLHHLLPGNSFLVCALDMAAWDIYGKMRGKPLYKLWELNAAKAPLTDYTIGIDSVSSMIDKMVSKPWPIYKIKAGMENDVDIIRHLRGHTKSVFRIDVNEGWTFDEAVRKIPQMKELGVELIEQPLPKSQWEEMKELKKISALPLFADEACVAEEDVDLCKDAFHGINIKLTKCGGITPARRMIKKARALSLSVMLGSMNESTVGTSALAHLAPMADHADMDGPLLQAEEFGKGVSFQNGKIVFPSGPGLGVTINAF
jgi:L-alanine-DL-glutamate epimerase-like enolase superfamily enzyme